MKYLLFIALILAGCTKDLEDNRKPNLFIKAVEITPEGTKAIYASRLPGKIIKAEFHITSPLPSIYPVTKMDYGAIFIPLSHFTGNFRLVTEKGIVWTEKYIY